MTKALHRTARGELARLETIIETTHRHILKMAQALAVIREKQLYKNSHSSFEDYCEARWGFSRAQGNRLVDWVEVHRNVSPIGDVLRESHARPLARLSAPQQRTAWKELTTGGTPTAKKVEEVCERIARTPTSNGKHGPTIDSDAHLAEIHLTRPLTWYGAKNAIAHRIVKMIPYHHTFVEGFFGSGAIFFAKKPSQVEIINDINGEVVNLFRILRHPAHNKALQCLLKCTPYAREEFKFCRENPKADNAIETARRFYVRCRQSYAGIVDDSWSLSFRNNRASEFVGAVDALDAVIQRLRRTQIEHKHFRDLLPRLDRSGAVYYLDPPYLSSTRFKQKVYQNEMTDAEHEELLDLITGLRHAKVILSGYRSPLYDRHLKKWKRFVFPVSNASASANGIREKREETVWRNY